MSDKLTAEQQLAALQKENEALAAENKALKEEVEANLLIIQEMNGQISAKDTELLSKASVPVITHKKEKYQVLVKRTTYKGKEVTAEILQKDEALMEELLKKNVGILKKI